MHRARHPNNFRAFTRTLLTQAFLILALTAAGCSSHRISANPPASTSATVSSAPNSRSSSSTTASTTVSPAPSPVNPRVGPNTSSPLGVSPEQGVASWYGVPFHGRRAANGEIYDMYKLTAAHRTLPFDTVVRVTNLANGLHTDVRITDRGPFVEDRVIDLSLAAARAIEMIGTGTAMVKIEIISGSSAPAASGNFAVQVGAFSDRANADRLKDQLAARYSPVLVEKFSAPSGYLFRVRVGIIPSVDAAQQLATKLANETGVRTFVVRLDAP